MSDAAELAAAEQKALDDAAAAEAAEAAEIESGFANEPTVTPPADEVPDQAAKDAAETAAEVEKAAAAAEVKYRQVSEKEWEELQAKVASIDSLRTEHRKELDKAFGKVGGLERTLSALQSATPAGYNVEVTDDIVADLKAEFPELGDLTLKALTKFAGKLKGTAPATQDPKETEAIVSQRLVAMQVEALEEDHPDWRVVVGDKDSNNEYRQWLAKQPAEYQQKLASTNSASVIAKSITRFQADAKTAADAAATAAAAVAAEAEKAAAAEAKKNSTRQRLAAAAAEKTTGATAAPESEDDFDAGFKSGPGGQKQ